MRDGGICVGFFVRGTIRANPSLVSRRVAFIEMQFEPQVFPEYVKMALRRCWNAKKRDFVMLGLTARCMSCGAWAGCISVPLMLVRGLELSESRQKRLFERSLPSCMILFPETLRQLYGG